MTPWLYAMLALLPVLAAQRAFGGNWPLHKARTWIVLVGASLAGFWAHDGGAPPLVAYCIIDGLAGIAIAQRPSGCPQRWVAGLFGMMVCLHLGFAFSAGYDVAGYYWAMTVLGWAQFAILALWGVSDAGTACGRNHRVRWALGLDRDAGASTGQAVR